VEKLFLKGIMDEVFYYLSENHPGKLQPIPSGIYEPEVIDVNEGCRACPEVNKIKS